MSYPYRQRDNQPPDTRKYAPAILRAIIAKPEMWHMGLVYYGEGRYAHKLHIHGDIVLTPEAAEVVKQFAIEKNGHPTRNPAVAHDFPAQDFRGADDKDKATQH